ncbi:uncharacterized protein LOC116246661 isoform X1 [Nymphaea colorata]|nr:uncharacterized protein LOC116246661 isoform X1 [Nymphaea colorata]
MLLHSHKLSGLKTKKVLFEENFPALDSGTLEYLKDLSSRRKALEESINGTSFTSEVIQREMSGGLTSQCQRDLQKLELYLPLLENLILQLDKIENKNRVFRWTSELRLRWSSAINASSMLNLGTPKFFQINDLRFELGMVLFLYGALLRERALEIIMSQDLAESCTLFRKAAGVYNYLAEDVLPVLQPLLPRERPIEVMTSMSNVMKLICLAEAQAVTTNRAEQRASSQNLLTKLQYGVTQFLLEARYIMKSDVDLYNVSNRLVDFISLNCLLHQARGQKHVAIELYEEGKIGLAIGVLRDAVSNMSGRSPSNESWHAVFSEEKSALRVILKRYEDENGFIYLERIPDAYELPSLEGKRIVEAIPYAPKRLGRELMFRI